MIFEQDKTIEKYGEKAGFLLSYIIFTTILYFIINIKSPWSYPQVIILTIAITLLGIILKRLLK